MNYLAVLYKSDSKGNIRLWRTWVEGSTIKTEAGLQDGQLILSEKTVRKGKNIGKVNETTPKEQARLQALSTAEKKRDSGYVDDMADVGNMDETRPLPMLAHEYNKRGHNIEWPADVQPKLDGVRCVAMLDKNDKVVLYSRKGKEFAGQLDHIKGAIHSLLSGNDGLRLDGELYAPDVLTFQELLGAVKRSKERAERKGKEFVDQHEYVEFHVFDCLGTGIPSSDDPWFTRYKFLQAILCNQPESSPIKLVDTHEVMDEMSMKVIHAQFSAAGYEGTIIRNRNAPYKIRHRSADLLKYKDFDTEEFKIVGAKQGDGKDRGTVIWRCQVPGAGEVDVRPRGTHKQRLRWYQNRGKYIGADLTVRFQGRTDDGSLRFPVGIAIRDYE